MEYRQLGTSGIEVSALALGTMMFGKWGNPDESACKQMVDAALAAGVTLFDTADIYDFGVSEEILGRALAGRRDSIVLATKVGNAMSDDPLQRGLSRRWILQSCDASLRRLGTDHIDLYQMHRPDPDIPIDETLQAFDELVQSGKVLAVGTSTFSVSQLDEARSRAEHLVSWSTAALDTQYESTFGNDWVPATLETLTIFPFVSMRCGRHFCIRTKIDRRLILIILSQSSSVVFSIVPFFMMPAELTRTSIRPKFATASDAIRPN